MGMEEYTPEQQEKIDKIIEVANLRINLLFHGMKRIQARITALHKQEFHIEAMILHSQAVEHSLRETLWAFRVKRELLDALGKDDPHEKVDLSEESLESSPLGGLIGKLKEITGETELVNELTYFNKNFRKQFVHRAYFTTEENFKAKEEEAKEYMKGEEKMGKLVRLLSDERIRALKEGEGLYPG
jgi:hypothetical protein